MTLPSFPIASGGRCNLEKKQCIEPMISHSVSFDNSRVLTREPTVCLIDNCSSVGALQTVPWVSCFCHTRCCLSVHCVAVGRLRGDNPPGAGLSVQSSIHLPRVASGPRKRRLGELPGVAARRNCFPANLPGPPHSHGGSTSRRIR
jgi:hypothetical protein